MRVTFMKLRAGVSFVQFKSTFGGNIRFVEKREGGGPGSYARDVTATARPDLSGILLEKEGFPPYVVPFESVDGFELDPESLPPVTQPKKTEPKQEPKKA